MISFSYTVATLWHNIGVPKHIRKEHAPRAYELYVYVKIVTKDYNLAYKQLLNAIRDVTCDHVIWGHSEH